MGAWLGWHKVLNATMDMLPRIQTGPVSDNQIFENPALLTGGSKCGVVCLCHAHHAYSAHLNSAVSSGGGGFQKLSEMVKKCHLFHGKRSTQQRPAGTQIHHRQRVFANILPIFSLLLSWGGPLAPSLISVLALQRSVTPTDSVYSHTLTTHHIYQNTRKPGSRANLYTTLSHILLDRTHTNTHKHHTYTPRTHPQTCYYTNSQISRFVSYSGLAPLCYS